LYIICGNCNFYATGLHDSDLPPVYDPHCNLKHTRNEGTT
jgi:hypothetical protein